MMGIKSARLILLFLGNFSFASCTGVGGLGNGGLIPTGSQGDTSGGSTEIDSGSSQPASGSTPDDAGVKFPVGSIPLPSLKNSSLVYRTDSNGYTPVVGMAGTVDAGYRNDGHVMAISTQPLDVAKAIHSIKLKQNLAELSRRHPSGFKLGSSVLGLSIIPDAHASDFAPDVNVNEMPAAVCSMDGVTCCPINEDGSFECYPFSSEESYHIAVVEKQSGQAMAATEEEQNKNIRWFGYAPQDVGIDTIFGQPTLYGLGQVQGAKMLNVDGELRVTGNHNDHYFDFETEGSTRVAMANNRVALLKPQTGIALPTVITQTIDNDDTRDVTIVDENPPVTVPDAKSYTVLKRTHSGDLMFGIESNPTVQLGWLYKIDATPVLKFTDPLLFTNLPLEFQIPHKRTIAFDVQKFNSNFILSIVIFEDKSGGQRIRLVTDDFNIDSTRQIFGGRNPLSGDHDFRDVIIYKQDSLSAEMGRSLILDAKGYVYLVDMHLDPITSKSWLTDTDSKLSANAIKIGKNPQAIALNKIKTKAYVVNKGDDTVSVISLPFYERALTARDVQKTQASVKTINLKDYLAEKSITIKPTQINYVVLGCQSSLAIASEGLKGTLMVPLNVPETEACPQNNPVEEESFAPIETTETVEVLSGEDNAVEVLPVKPLPNTSPLKPFKPIKPISRPIKQPSAATPIPDYEAPEVR